MYSNSFMKIRPRRYLALALALPFFLSCGSGAHESSLHDRPLPAAPAVDASRELVFVHSTILNDAAMTSNQNGSSGRPGRWSFRYLIEEMTPAGMDAADFVRTWLDDYKATQVNGFAVTQRSGVDAFIADWPKRTDGKLDLQRSPFKLLAIVNRIDVAKTESDIGEGRFVFGALDAAGNPLPFTVIFEYNLPRPKPNKSTEENRQMWAQRFHDLGWVREKVNNKWTMVPRPFGPQFNQELAKLTDQFAKRGANPSGVNGNSLSQLRSNEIALGQPWSLREFRLQPNGTLRIAPTAQTPDGTFNNQHPNPGGGSPFVSRSPELIQFLRTNADRVLNEEHSIPASMLAGESLENFGSTLWLRDPATGGTIPITGDAVIDESLRKTFAVNTCNGCHNGEVQQIAGFYHVSPFGGPATGDGTERLSDFMKVDDIPRRVAFLQHQLCGGECAVPGEIAPHPGKSQKFKKAKKPSKRPH